MGRSKVPVSLRRKPSQARAKRTVELLLEGATRVFRSEGFDATTNRIAAKAGFSVGTLYEYFPNKQSLLIALAERHLDSAERGISAALALSGDDLARFLRALQRAILASQRYPSQAVALVADEPQGAALRERASTLRQRVLLALTERARAAGLPEPELRAQASFAVLAELSCRVAYELKTPDAYEPLTNHFLEMACAHLHSAADAHAPAAASAPDRK